MFQSINRVVSLLQNLSVIESRLKVQEYNRFIKDLSTTDNTSFVSFGYSVYSQNDEDGILAKIFDEIGIGKKIAVEIAAGDGLENNTHIFLHKKWNCIWFESNKELVESINKKFSNFIEKGQLRVMKAWVSHNNIEKHFQSLKIPKDFDLLSLDIDGQEYWLWDAITNFKPRVIVVEYNSSLGPDLNITSKKSESFVWDGKSVGYGSSLKALVGLANKKGYSLVACNYTGVNAFFVRNDLLSSKRRQKDWKELYQPPRIGWFVKTGYKPAVTEWEYLE